jgi:hypothetical protein
MRQHVLNCSYKDAINNFMDYEGYRVAIKAALLDAVLKKEREYWEIVQNNNNRQAYENYLKIYPNGVFSKVAYERIIKFISQQKISYEKSMQKEKLKLLLSWINEAAGSSSSFSYSHSDYKGCPRDIKELEDLVSLDINLYSLGKVITEFSEHIGVLGNLKRLCIDYGGKEIKIPSSVGNLLDLTELEINLRNLQEIPQSIGNLVNLKTLSINNNYGSFFITNPNIIPDHDYHFIRNLKNLEHLEIIATHFTNLPESVRNLSKLTKLDISRNQIQELPEWIGELKTITKLDVSNNSLKSFPKSMRKLTNLTYINLDNNNLLLMPKLFFQIRSMGLWHATSYALSYALK